jgi:hypothetical protein
MKYAAEMGSGALVYIPRFIKISPGIQKLIGRMDSQTHRYTLRWHGDRISVLSFLKIRTVR